MNPVWHRWIAEQGLLEQGFCEAEKVDVGINGESAIVASSDAFGLYLLAMASNCLLWYGEVNKVWHHYNMINRRGKG